MTGFYYLSFCDTTKPKGTQFLGATCVAAENEEDALELATALGLNPGGEVALMRLRVRSSAELPPEAQKYLNRFVSREVVMSEASDQETLEHFNDHAARICQDCNE